MTDKELIELAAKAAGYNCSLSERYDCAEIWKDGDKVKKFWQPLVDDGDALRLAVKLNLLYGKVFTRSVADNHEDGDDIYAATRRAIVRAAAQIGKEME